MFANIDYYLKNYAKTVVLTGYFKVLYIIMLIYYLKFVISTLLKIQCKQLSHSTFFIENSYRTAIYLFWPIIWPIIRSY